MEIAEVWCDYGRWNWLRFLSSCGRLYLDSFIGEMIVCKLLLE
jgi:hypothetical protein